MLAVVTEYDEYSRVFLNGGTVLVVTSFYNLIGLVPLNMLSFIIYTALNHQTVLVLYSRGHLTRVCLLTLEMLGWIDKYMVKEN